MQSFVSNYFPANEDMIKANDYPIFGATLKDRSY